MAAEPKAATEEAKIDLFEDDDEFEEFEINESKSFRFHYGTIKRANKFFGFFFSLEICLI